MSSKVSTGPIAPEGPLDVAVSTPNVSAFTKLLGIGTAVLFLAVLFTPAIAFSDDKYWLPLFTRYMALALFALSVDLIWGYTGLMSLGQGVYFGLGVYCVGFSLMFQKACEDAGLPLVQQESMPRFALQPFLPDWVGYLVHIWLAIPLAIILPVILASAFGYAAFQRRIKGVYFSLITQALLLAFFSLTEGSLPITGGEVGMPYLPRLKLFGHEFMMLDQYYLTFAMVAVCFLLSLALIRSKFGKVLTAIRDSEYRVMALGYNTAMYKTFIFAYGAAVAGIAGGLYVASLRTAGPDVLKPAFSIEVLILVAVGGRGTLYGAIIGAILVNLGKTVINDQFSNYWPIILGLLFVLTTLFLPEGILGGLRSVYRRFGQSQKKDLAATPQLQQG
jgi:urea transport system permease protein